MGHGRPGDRAVDAEGGCGSCNRNWETRLAHQRGQRRLSDTRRDQPGEQRTHARIDLLSRQVFGAKSKEFAISGPDLAPLALRTIRSRAFRVTYKAWTRLVDSLSGVPRQEKPGDADHRNSVADAEHFRGSIVRQNRADHAERNRDEQEGSDRFQIGKSKPQISVYGRAKS